MRSRGLKDDTTCLVVDIIPSDQPVLPSTPMKKQNALSSFLFRKRSQSSTNKTTNKLSAVGVVEELFEEGSAMLAERFIHLEIFLLIYLFLLSLLYKMSVGKEYGLSSNKLAEVTKQFPQSFFINVLVTCIRK